MTTTTCLWEGFYICKMWGKFIQHLAKVDSYLKYTEVVKLLKDKQNGLITKLLNHTTYIYKIAWN